MSRKVKSCILCARKPFVQHDCHWLKLPKDMPWQIGDVVSGSHGQLRPYIELPTELPRGENVGEKEDENGRKIN